MPSFASVSAATSFYRNQHKPDSGNCVQRAISPDSSPDRLMEEGMPESTINVPVPSYPAEFGNEAYRIEQDLEARESAGQNSSHGPAAAPDDYYSSVSMPPQGQAAQHSSRCCCAT